MKKLILILSLLIPSIALAHESHHHKNSETLITEKEYHCSMHPKITGERTDRCSKCGMFLVKKKVKNEYKNNSMKMKLSEKEKDTYICPMNSKITSDKKERCHKCNMFLVKKEKEYKNHSIKMKSHDCAEHKAKNGNCSKCKEHKKKTIFKSSKHNCSEHKSKNSHCSECKEHSKSKDTYVCPMHSDITSDKKDRCSKCGMFLKIQKVK